MATNMKEDRQVLTSESVSEGHPDKVCDQISDAVLDACLAQDPESRVACETLATTNRVVVAGEITTKAQVNWEQLARKVIRDIGYTDPAAGFSADEAKIEIALHQQSPDISQGVTASTSLSGEQGAGDQGMMFGFACSETDQFMPATIYYSHRLMERFASLRHNEPEKYAFLRPDAKAQLSFLYEGDQPVAIENIVVSHQHTPEMQRETLEELVRQVVADIIPARFLTETTKYWVNPTGRFVIGGPAGDAGLTGRKIIVDTYGGIARHGGGAFSGKDPSKVDRSAAYMARYAAKNLVAAGIAKRCEIQVAYAIGVAKPLSFHVETNGTGIVPDSQIAAILREGKLFDFRPAAISEALSLKKPQGWCYQESASCGHFGRPQFSWEKCDRIAAIKAAF